MASEQSPPGQLSATQRKAPAKSVNGDTTAEAEWAAGLPAAHKTQNLYCH